VRSVEPAGIRERGRGMGWILQEPGRSAIDQLQIAEGTGLERDQALRKSPPHGSELGEEVGAGKRIISDSVFGAGSLSALIVLMTSGNAAQADPIEGSGASLYRIAFEKHGGCFET
jgi:hypothetical protein